MRFLFIIFLITVSGNAFASCNGIQDIIPDPIITLSPYEISISIDNSKSSQEISSLTKRQGFKDDKGLTVSDLETKTQFYIPVIQRENSSCSFIDKLEVKTGFIENVIYIDNKYQPGSCQYEALVKHELMHVNAAQLAVLSTIEQVKTKLKNDLGKKVYENKSKESIKKEIQETINLVVTDKIKKELEHLNARIDAKDNYLSVKSSCNTW